MKLPAILFALCLSFTACRATHPINPGTPPEGLVGRWLDVEDRALSVTFRKDSSVAVRDHRTDALRDDEGRYRVRDGILVIEKVEGWTGSYRMILEGDTLRLTGDREDENVYRREGLPAASEVAGRWNVVTLYDSKRQLSLDENGSSEGAIFVTAMDLTAGGRLVFAVSDGRSINGRYALVTDVLRISGSGWLGIDGEYRLAFFADRLELKGTDVEIELER